MKIKALKIYGMYGYMDKEVYFNDDENYLVGINGSGKTTVIKILDAFLRRDFSFLEKNKFDEITITTNNNFFRIRNDIAVGDNENEERLYIYDKNHHIQTKKKLNESIIELESKIKAWNKILKEKRQKEIILSIERDLVKFSIMLEEMKQEKSEIDSKDTIYVQPIIDFQKEESFNLNYITLGIDKEFEEKTLIIDELKKEEYKSFKEKTEIINFLFPIQKVEFLLQDVGKKFLQFKSQIMSNKVKKINSISGIKSTIEKVSKSLDLEILIETEEELKKLLKFEEIINNFLEDSYKKLNFNDILGEFSFNILNKEREVIATIENLNYLSSGEKQLIVLFTELYFNLKENTILLIDEPDKSLHIEWQKKFLPTLKEIIKPISDKVQLIIATHSANLVGEVDRDKFIPLYPYNEVNTGE